MLLIRASKPSAHTCQEQGYFWSTNRHINYTLDGIFNWIDFTAQE